MPQLSYEERQDLPSSDFVFPKARRYPIPDEAHARNALARVSQNGTEKEKMKVFSEVAKRYPEISTAEYVKHGKRLSRRERMRKVLSR